MTDTPRDLTKPIGSPGLPAYAGRVQDEYDIRLRGDRLLKTYTEMGNDPTIRSFLFAFDTESSPPTRASPPRRSRTSSTTPSTTWTGRGATRFRRC